MYIIYSVYDINRDCMWYLYFNIINICICNVEKMCTTIYIKSLYIKEYICSFI